MPLIECHVSEQVEIRVKMMNEFVVEQKRATLVVTGRQVRLRNLTNIQRQRRL